MNSKLNSKLILVPTDFSPSAAAALQCATELAQARQAQLAIVHVELAPELKGPYDDEDDPQQHRAERLLENISPSDPSISVQRHLLKGSIATRILEFAGEQAVSAIVMGTHGQTNSAEVVMGTVAEAVARRAPCLVVAVRPPATP